MSNWLEKYQQGIEKANNVVWYLENLSGLLYEVGNNVLGRRVNKMSVNLSDALKEINGAINQNFNEQVKQCNEKN